MTGAVVNLMKISPKSIIASNRIAQYLCEVTGYPLVDHKSLCSSFDEIIIVNGPMLYCGFREQLKDMVQAAERVIWVCNDYTIPAPSYVKNKPALFWSSCDPAKNQDKYIYTNWNQLTHICGIQPRSPKHKGLCYYGAFREGRRDDFRKYLDTDLYQTHISSSKNGERKFREISPKARYFSSSNITAALGDFECALYIEDKKSHNFYTSPANRFYEALSSGTPQLFDISCLETFARAKIDIDRWIVHDAESVADKLKSIKKVREEQAEAFKNADFMGALTLEVRSALRDMPSKF